MGERLDWRGQTGSGPVAAHGASCVHLKFTTTRSPFLGAAPPPMRRSRKRTLLASSVQSSVSTSSAPLSSCATSSLVFTCSPIDPTTRNATHAKPPAMLWSRGTFSYPALALNNIMQRVPGAAVTDSSTEFHERGSASLPHGTLLLTDCHECFETER
jgi:hypothetical protein